MKVAQNDETNPDTRSVRRPHTPNLSNPQLSPSGSSARKRETPGILSRMLSPFVGITYYRVRAPLGPRIASFCLWYFDCSVIYCVPLGYLFPVDPEIAADTPVIDYINDDPSFLPEQPGKPPLINPISPILLSTSCIRVV